MRDERGRDRGGPHRRTDREGFGPDDFGLEGGRRRLRMRRGDIRTAVLAALDEQPRHGYELIQALEEKSGGAWRPSAGSVYPMLQQLEDEDLARSTERDGKRVYEATDAGRAEARVRVDQAGGPPWQGARAGGGLRGAIGQLAVAARQVNVAGTPEQVEQVQVILTDARKAIYRLLAED